MGEIDNSFTEIIQVAEKIANYEMEEFEIDDERRRRERAYEKTLTGDDIGIMGFGASAEECLKAKETTNQLIEQMNGKSGVDKTNE